MRHPFTSRLNDYLDVKMSSDEWAEGTFDDRARMLRHMGRTVVKLEEEGRISTQDPKYMTPRDIAAIMEAEMLSHPMRVETRRRKLKLLDDLCTFCENPNIVDVAKKQNPLIKGGRKRRKEKLHLTEEQCDQILDGYWEQKTFEQKRPYAMAVLSLYAGCRSDEARFAKVENYDAELGELYLDHVKGQETYGEPRSVPIIPKAIPVIEDYLEVRETAIAETKVPSPYFFFNSWTGEVLSENASNRFRAEIEEDLGFHFTLRMCRATYFQRLVDVYRIDPAKVSKIAGHLDERTIYEYYINLNVREALNEAHMAFNAGGPITVQDLKEAVESELSCILEDESLDQSIREQIVARIRARMDGVLSGGYAKRYRCIIHPLKTF